MCACECVLAAVQQEAAAAAAAQTKEKFTTGQERDEETETIWEKGREREKLFASCCVGCFIDALRAKALYVCVRATVCVCIYNVHVLRVASMVQPGVYVMRYDVFAWRFTRPTAIAYLQQRQRRMKGWRGKGCLVAAIVNIYLSYKINQKKKRKKKPQRAEQPQKLYRSPGL